MSTTTTTKTYKVRIPYKFRIRVLTFANGSTEITAQARQWWSPIWSYVSNWGSLYLEKDTGVFCKDEDGARTRINRFKHEYTDKKLGKRVVECVIIPVE